MMLVVLGLSLPIGVAASIYLEEFAPQNRFTDFIEVNISNLAAVPSIVFGILGLAVFIQFAHLPQSAPLVGGLTLTLMTLPTIVISTRASLKAVPPSIRDAALGVGASKMQAVFHHVLPLAMPGILTGTIIGLAQALGETAPLLLIGMVGLIATKYPDSMGALFLDPNSAMPAQIYTWAARSDDAFYEKAWGGIIVLLVFLLVMNLLAILLRRRFERRW
jgi:phosphate transport system permease protein